MEGAEVISILLLLDNSIISHCGERSCTEVFGGPSDHWGEVLGGAITEPKGAWTGWRLWVHTEMCSPGIT